jgi:prevent-host-death family protein
VRTEIKIAEFKSHLSAHLRAVRRGQEIVIKDRETPIARVVPYEAPARRLVTRRPTIPLKNVARLPGVKIRLKPGELDKALRQTRMDYFDKWSARKLT